MTRQFIKLYFIGILGLACISCSGDDPIDDPGTNPNPDPNPGGTTPGGIKTLDYGELLAFPYAEGHGRNTTGGRGGTVYHVTSLEDNTQSGTLRHALNQNGAKTIVFDVSGTIQLTSELRTRSNDLTIAGQTSPGGICIAGYPFVINSDNVIIRFVRFRPGNVNVDSDGLGGFDRKTS